MRKGYLQIITTTGILVAISFVLHFFSIRITDFFQLGFSEFPIMLSGLLFGPLFGGITGFIKDILVGITSGYPPSLFTLAQIALGVVPGIFVVIFNRDKIFNNILFVYLIILLTMIIRSFINQFAIYFLYGTPVNVLVVTFGLKALLSIVEAFIYTIIFKLLINPIKRILNN